MSWLETILAKLEARLQSLIESSASGNLTRKYENELTVKVLQAMRDGVQEKSVGMDAGSAPFFAPDLYILVLPPAQAEMLLTQPVHLDHLAQRLKTTAAQTGIQFASPPMVRVVADPAANGLHVQAQFNSFGRGDASTARLDGLPGAHEPQAETLPGAFLIVDGLQTFPLTQPVVNIGRDPANHLRLDDPRVSRNHAQLRFIQGRFVIFDLDSTGGTFVNSVAVSSHPLNTGDVISLAGVPLVFGEEAGTMAGYTQELPAEPPPPEVL